MNRIQIVNFDAAIMNFLFEYIFRSIPSNAYQKLDITGTLSLFNRWTTNDVFDFIVGFIYKL